VTRTPRRRDERGAAAILVALLAVSLIGAMAFVSDFGFAYVNQRRVQTGSDAAALAVARKIAAGAPGTANCATIAGSWQNAAQRSYAASILGKNALPTAGLDTATAGFSVSCEQVGSNNQTLVVKVKGVQASPTFLGGLFGSSKIDVSAQAKAIVAPLGTVVGLRPFALCQAAANLVNAQPGTLITYGFDNSDAGCGFAPGNWGVLDFNGGSNPTGEIADWILHGYGEPVSVVSPVYVPGNPGAPNPGALDSEMDQMMTLGEIVLPVFDNISGSGNNSQFRITGFVSVKPCGWKFNNKSGNDPSCFVPPTSPVPDNYLQIKLAKFIPVGSLNLACKLGNSACDNGPRGVALAD